MIELRADGVTHVYRDGGVRAVDGVDLVIEPGEAVAIVGQNGSGKTTLVQHFNGLLRPTSGSVRVGGVDTRGRRVAELARLVGLAFQDPDRQLFSGRVRDEVEFGPRNVGLRGDELRRARDDALAAVGLVAEADTNPYDLGPSQRKLLALASVLAMRTPAVILDEPTTGQDLAGARRVRDVVAGLRSNGRTVVAISHDMEFVADAFERVVVMRLGRIVFDGPRERAFAASAWDILASTHLEPPPAARLGERLGLGPTANDAALAAALRARASGRVSGSSQ